MYASINDLIYKIKKTFHKTIVTYTMIKVNIMI